MSNLDAYLKEVRERNTETPFSSNPGTYIKSSADIPLLLLIIEEMRAALNSIDYNLEGYEDGRCDACLYNLNTIRPEAREALPTCETLATKAMGEKE